MGKEIIPSLSVFFLSFFSQKSSSSSDQRSLSLPQHEQQSGFSMSKGLLKVLSFGRLKHKSEYEYLTERHVEPDENNKHNP